MNAVYEGRVLSELRNTSASDRQAFFAPPELTPRDILAYVDWQGHYTRGQDHIKAHFEGALHDLQSNIYKKDDRREVLPAPDLAKLLRWWAGSDRRPHNARRLRISYKPVDEPAGQWPFVHACTKEVEIRHKYEPDAGWKFRQDLWRAVHHAADSANGIV